MIFVLLLTLLASIAIVFLQHSHNHFLELLSNYVTGETENIISVDEVIPFKERKVNDDNLENGITKVKQEGVNGKKKIIFRVTKDRNGAEINRARVGEEVITEPIDKIVAVGTKKVSANNNTNRAPSSNSNNGSGNNNASNNSSNNKSIGSDRSQPSSSTNPTKTPDNNNTSTIHYCSNRLMTTRQTSDHILIWTRTYIKTNVPCGHTGSKYDSHGVEISAAEYNLAQSKPYHTPKYGVLETASRDCGVAVDDNDYYLKNGYKHMDTSCYSNYIENWW